MIKLFKPVSLVLLAVALCSPGTISASVGTITESTAVAQQSKKVTGVVEDVMGPVAGASVVVKGTTNGTITDLDGRFVLDVKEGETIVVSFIGYIAQEFPVTGQNSYKIDLVEDSQTLDEVVVTALGIKRDAKKLGYAVSTIAAGELTKTASPTLGSALYGKAAGVRIQTAPGGTGSISINVRGINSITGNNQPLVIVDGVPIRNGNANNDGFWGDQRVNSNGLADINPEDIETLSILKGASASALYGSEAANGVVMITTKSGKGVTGFGVEVGASVVGDFVAYMPKYQTTYGPGTITRSRSSYQTNGPLDNPNWADGWYVREDRHGNVHNSVLTATGQWGPKYDGSDILYYDGTVRKYEPYSSNPWSDVFRTGLTQQYNVGITNATDKGNLRLAYTYNDSKPTQYNSSNKRHNFNLTGSYNISNTLKVDYSANYILQDIKNRPYRINRLTANFGGMFSAFDDVKWYRENAITSLGYMNQVYTAASHLTPDEGYEWVPAISDFGGQYLWNVLANNTLENNNRLIASVAPSWQIIDGLILRGRVATDYTSEKIEDQRNTEQSLLVHNPTGSYTLKNHRYQTIFGDVMLTYDKDLTDKIGLNALVGWQGKNESVFKSEVGTEGGLSVENWFHLNASSDTKRAGMTKNEFLRTAWLGTVTLSYDGWAFLEGTARQEKISTLAKNNNTFFYPSVNASIIYTELLNEKTPSWYDYGKVRVSYGIVGNAPEIYRANQAYIQKNVGSWIYNTVSTTVGNEEIRPEKKYEWEIGWESKFLQNRLGVDASFYTNKVKDQILDATMPGSSGGRELLMNIGELQNKGFELAVYGTPFRNKDWNWDLRANISWYRNEVTKLADGIDRITHWSQDGGSAFLYSFVGRPVGDIYALMPVEDENGNKIVNSDGFYQLTDEPVRVGNSQPKLTGGFGTSVAYKSFFFDATLDFRIGGAVYNEPYNLFMSRGSLVQSMKYRDAEHGGQTYYLDSENNCVPYSGTVGPNGQKVYDNGMILKGVKEDGTPNDIMIGSDYYYSSIYGWGGSNPDGVRYYGHSVFDNSYVKVRELSFGYNLPASILSKFMCKTMQVSVFARNPFYIYKNMPAMDAEATDATNWIEQTRIGGSTATTRSFGVSLRASF